MRVFNRDKKDVIDPTDHQSILDFMNQNAEVTEEPNPEDSKNKELQKSSSLNLTGDQTRLTEPLKYSKDQ